MPNYVFECDKCKEHSIMFRKLADYVEFLHGYCPNCKQEAVMELVIEPMAIEDWGNDGKGRFFEDLSPQGMYFHDKKSYNQYLKQNGLREWVPKSGMPG
jgi:hypothetical protein